MLSIDDHHDSVVPGCRSQRAAVWRPTRASAIALRVVRRMPSGSRHHPIISGARLAARQRRADGAPARLPAAALSRRKPRQNKAPPSTKPGALRFRSGLCGCPEHHGRICQVAAQSKPCLLTGEESGRSGGASCSTVVVGPWDLARSECPVVDLTTSGHRLPWWKRRAYRIVGGERRSDDPPSISSPLRSGLELLDVVCRPGHGPVSRQTGGVRPQALDIASIALASARPLLCVED